MSKVRYSIPFFQAVKLSLTLDELKKSAKDIVARIPAKEEEKDGKSVGNDVISELISPEYCSVSRPHDDLEWKKVIANTL